MPDHKWLNSHAYERNISADEVMPARLRAKLQIEINKIIGVEPDGTLRWRLVWGQDDDLKVWQRYQLRWLHKYYWDDVEVTYQDSETKLCVTRRESIGRPRFYVEALVPRAMRNAAAEGSGTDVEVMQDEGPTDEDGNPIPENGKFRTYEERTNFDARRMVGEEYITMFMITRHTRLLSKEGVPLCCEARRLDGLACLGEYVEPGDLLLNLLRQRAAEFKGRFRLSRNDLAGKQEAYGEAMRFMKEEAAQKQKLHEELRQTFNLADFVRAQSQDNPGALKNRFSIPGL